MCTEQSNPSMELKDVSNPTMNATPIVGQLPPFSKWSKAVLASFRGDRTKRGMTIAKTPTTWTSRISPSTSGSFLAKEVLNMIENAITAITMRVPCHG